MARRVDIVLSEILETIERVRSVTEGKSLDDFKGDWLLKLAIQRALEIISEACRHIPDDLLAQAPEIPWIQIKGVGNVLRHEYHRIADDIVWSVVTDHLPPLERAVVMLCKLVRAADANS